eukprot:9563759-Ditylum_brightwellii.AAC.1
MMPTSETYRHYPCLCADGSASIFGIDYNEKYSPVAFPWAPLENEELFIEIPAGIYHKDSDTTKGFVLFLKKSLYGFKQASFNWNELLRKGLLKQDDTIFFATDESITNKEINSSN